MTLLYLPRYHSASQLFADINVPAFQAVIRNLIYITRLDKSQNIIIQGFFLIGESDLRLTFAIWRHVEALVQMTLRRPTF